MQENKCYHYAKDGDTTLSESPTASCSKLKLLSSQQSRLPTDLPDPSNRPLRGDIIVDSIKYKISSLLLEIPR